MSPLLHGVFDLLLFSHHAELHNDNIPDTVITDGLGAYPRAIREKLGEDVEHEVCPCTANPVAQSHRVVKHRYYPTLGFDQFEAAQRFCLAVDEVNNFLSPRSQMAEPLSLSDRRKRFLNGVEELESLFYAV